MNYPTEHQNISIPISANFRDTALKFAQEQPNPEKSKQVYLNTLAVQVVNNYLQLLDIPTAIEASYSWDSWGRMGGNVADLVLTGIGHLECRYMRTGEEICDIPPEVWDDRFGYLVIEINQTCQEAKIRGFLPQVRTTEISLQKLEPLEKFLEHYHQFSSVKLRQWLEGIYTSQWQNVEEWSVNKSPQLAFRSLKVRGFEVDTINNIWQVIEQLYPQHSWKNLLPSTLLPNSDIAITDILVHLLQTTNDEEIRWTLAEILWTITPNHPVIIARRVMDIGMQLGGNPVALMVAILPKPDKSFAVLLRVYPMGNRTYLPADLLLSGLYENGQPFLEVTAREQGDNYIQLKFCAELGEKFQIRVTLNNATITEKFVI
jgi:hypothetical protein